MKEVQCIYSNECNIIPLCSQNVLGIVVIFESCKSLAIIRLFLSNVTGVLVDFLQNEFKL